MLINHIDRQDTHIASAVLQIGQRIDKDGGWPLEILHPHHPVRCQFENTNFCRSIAPSLYYPAASELSLANNPKMVCRSDLTLAKW